MAGVVVAAAVLVLSYLLDVRVRHQVAGQHLVGLAGQRGQGGRLLLWEAVAQHGQLGAAGQRQETLELKLKLLQQGGRLLLDQGHRHLADQIWRN